VLQLLALARPLPLAALVVGGGLVFCGITILNIYWTTMEQQHVPAEALSRVDSLSWLASLVVLPIGLVVVGPVAASIGVRVALLAAAGLAALAVVGVLSVRDVRELRRVEQPAAEEPVMTAASTGA
jgi:nicotinamide riboside transporter PnuC